MPIKETFVEETTPGIDPIPFDQWLAQQSTSDQERFYQARARADAYRQEAIDTGRLSIEPGTGSYIWKDQEMKRQGKRQDKECMNFYAKFNADTGRRIIYVSTEI